MKRKLFVIPSLIAAGLFPAKVDAMPRLVDPAAGSDKGKSLFDVFRLAHKYTLAGHRSHSSHSSHSSHRSSSGGSYSRSPSYSTPSPSYSAPLYSPPTYSPPASAVRPPASTTPTPLYSAPGAATEPPARQPMQLAPKSVEPRQPQTLSGSTNKFAAIVRQVQTAMAAYGYYKGSINGAVDADMREALTKMQTDYGLKATGTITPQTLDALRIVAE